MRRSLVLVVVLGCATPRPAPRTDEARVDALADDYVRVYHRAHPEDADRAGWPGVAHDRLSDRSPAGIAAWDREVDRIDEAQRAIDADHLRGPAWTTLGLLREELAGQRAQRICRRERWAVDHLGGWQVELPALAAVQPVGTPALRDQALARWRDLPRYVDVEIANLRDGLRAGYAVPKSVVARVLAELEPLASAAPEASPFYDPARRDRDPAFQSTWRELVTSAITPAIARYRAFLRDEYLPAARDELGISHNPDGVACWRALFRIQTSLERAPEDTQRLGEARVATLMHEIAAIGERAFATADPIAIVQRAQGDPAARFADDDAVLAFMRETAERARRAMPQILREVPPTDVRIEPFPAYASDGASDRYERASEDGSRPARYLVNLAFDRDAGRGQAEITVFHEAWPGHHLQIAVADRRAAHPLAKLAQTTAFVEGWARYAEQLADELGLYRSDAARILRRAWPGRGMVVDPGIHLFGWTRERAIAFLAESGMPVTVADALVDRISVWPAQLTAYDTGALEIFALRDEARAKLGDRFDLSRFHACVLAAGPVTLRMLRELVVSCLRSR